MRTSVIIPVWNGESVIGQCLTALFSSPADAPYEVICVENASRDGSLDVLHQWPRVQVLPQRVNLGFAGGILAGAAAASGDLLFLLNQDAMVRPGWLAAITKALEARREAGIAGCTIYHADGSLDHAGATMTRPQADGMHLTDRGDGQPRPVEYVTGAAMAIRRSCWDALGGMDAGFYPAYYEEADFCLRAAERGMTTLYVPAAEVDHVRSSRESQADPIKHWANQERSRYRFVSKHFRDAVLQEFFAYEEGALARENSYAMAVGRLLGARDTLRALPDLLIRRGMELERAEPTAVQVQLTVGFTQVLRLAFAATQRLQPLPLRSPASTATPLAPRASGVRSVRRGLGRTLGRLTAAVGGAAAAPAGDLADQCAALERRLTLLETLVSYDYR